ncbi:glycosyltransferase family 4 protein [Phycicoccus sp. Soil748]|uniref:glycosyltransferase family 4 protein n=1 Tax=Phycicoccus sp. Soil748 TaxID=1736397 RepID=UPI0012E36162|nr:glycosyltransferase family 4 protein [Phycicoccus sp. Soil748]
MRCEALFEDAMGHRSFARSIQASLASDPLIAIDWHPVAHEAPAGVPRHRKLFPLHVAWNARTVLSTLDLSAVDCLLLHTHWVAVGAMTRRLPGYVVCTDATPRAYASADSRVPPRSRPSLRSRPLQLAVDRAMSGARRVVALSEWTAQHLMDDEGVPGERLRVVPPGVDTDLFFPRQRDGDVVRIAFVGYDFDRKGGQLLLDWARTTRTTGWELHLVSPQAPVDLPARVIGHRDVRDVAAVADLLGRSDIFVLPTGQDIVPVAVIEALASGCAVVATSVGAIPELLDGGRAGALFRAGSAPELGRTLDELVNDADRRHHLADAGRDRAVLCYDIARTSLVMRSTLLEAAS